MKTCLKALLCSTLLITLGCEQHHRLTPRNEACVVGKTASFDRPVDVLLVVDNSGSMREEQASLRAQVPRLIEAFTSGDLDADGVPEYPAVADLHIGVTSTDLGLPDVEGREGLGCGTDAAFHGDDGALLVRPDTTTTDCAVPDLDAPFVAWQPKGDSSDATALTQVVQDVSCIATLGTVGCGFEQQLEATLKALWPSDNTIDGETVSLDRPFYADSNGQGGPDGANAGFLRNEPGNESLVIVVMLTDENDCSSHDLSHFTPDHILGQSDPLFGVGLNLRCLMAQENLFAVSRYVDGLKALRPNNPDLVQFVAIAGVPSDLVDPSVDLSDTTMHAAYYDAMLSDDRMQEVIDPDSLMGNPNLFASCTRTWVDPETGFDVVQRAFPPRRIVETARGFGRNGFVESICQDDYTQIADRLLSRTFDTLKRTSCPGE